MTIIANPGIKARADQLAALHGQSVKEAVIQGIRTELARKPRPSTGARALDPNSPSLAKVARIMELVRAARPVVAGTGDHMGSSTTTTACRTECRTP
jgi:hypothetical protein